MKLKNYYSCNDDDILTPSDAELDEVAENIEEYKEELREEQNKN